MTIHKHKVVFIVLVEWVLMGGIYIINFWGNDYCLIYPDVTLGNLSTGKLILTNEFFAFKGYNWNGPLKIYLEEGNCKID